MHTQSGRGQRRLARHHSKYGFLKRSTARRGGQGRPEGLVDLQGPEDLGDPLRPLCLAAPLFLGGLEIPEVPAAPQAPPDLEALAALSDLSLQAAPEGPVHLAARSVHLMHTERRAPHEYASVVKA